MGQHKIRIAFVVHSFSVGGLERCVAHLANRLPDRFEASIVAVSGIGKAQEWLERSDINLYDLRKSFGNDPRVYTRLRKFLISNSIDIVHSHNWGTLLETSVARAFTRCHHVHAEHGLDYGKGASGIKGLARAQLRKVATRRVDVLVAVASAVQNWLSTHFVGGKQQIELIRNGVQAPLGVRSAGAGERLRGELGLHCDAILFGSVGRLVHVKGFDIAIQAFKHAIAQVQSGHLVLVGDGPESERLQNLACESGLKDRVHFVGHQTNVGEWLKAMDIYVNSSRSEAMSLSILEAMSAGLPIVATDVGDNRFLLENNQPCGVVVNAENPQELASSLVRLASDLSQCKIFAANSLTVYNEHYTLEKMVDRYAQLYESLVDR